MSTEASAELEIFVRVVDEGSFTAAARSLGVSTSHVSRRVKLLEDRLGVRLLERTTRRVRPTDVGRRYRDRVAPLLDGLDEAAREARSLQAAPRGVLRLAAPLAFGLRYLGPELSRFLRAWPELEVESSHTLSVGGREFETHHAKGETDDHLWTWVPDHKALCVGDLVTWVFPNCGNPQKVQRYPLEWAQALREMMTYEAEWLLPAHGLVVRGADRVTTVLGDLATALELLTEETLAMMNAGESLDAIIHQVTVPDDLLVKPWMQPVYDEPEFVVRNLWRLYGGWWDKNPAHLKPAPESVFATEMAALAGGADALTARATELAAAGDLRLACQVVELAVQADPESTNAHGARAEIYQQRRNEEFSLMSKGIFAAAARESRAIADQ